MNFPRFHKNVNSLEIVHQKGLFDAIKENPNFPHCRRILDIYWQWLLIRSQFSLRLNCYEMLWLCVVSIRLQGFPLSFYGNLSEELFIMGFQCTRIDYGYDFCLCFETSTRGTNSMPFLVFWRDHLRSPSGIICGSESFAVQFGDHLRFRDLLRRCITLYCLNRNLQLII